jgi:hypothetical protein
VNQGITVHRPSWIGIDDRDEWREADVVAAADKSPRLHILPRFCIESYLCDPGELWTALPASQRDRVAEGINVLQKLRDAPILPPPDLIALFDRILAQLPQAGPP